MFTNVFELCAILANVDSGFSGGPTCRESG